MILVQYTEEVKLEIACCTNCKTWDLAFLIKFTNTSLTFVSPEIMPFLIFGYKENKEIFLKVLLATMIQFDFWHFSKN